MCALLKYFVLLFFIFTATACTKKERQVTPAFYHWKTNFDLSNQETKYLEKFGATKIYVKFFDIDSNSELKEAMPVAEVRFISDPKHYEIVPTVFITNRTLQQIELAELKSLAEKMIGNIQVLAKQQPYTEIQLDCDWSASTQEKYFELIRHIQTLKPELTISATIRLHQVKYMNLTGVPPVDKGMLMFYNMGNVEDPASKNSILDLDIARQYIFNFENYTIPLDVALPLFSWAVLFRDGKMIKLINHATNEITTDTSRFENIDSTHFKVIKSTYLNGHYLYTADELRIERITQQDLKQCVNLLKDHLQNDDLVVSFYHLDSTIINQFPHDFLEEVCHSFY